MRLYDTHSQTHKPLDISSDQLAKLYVCGPTVYDHCHIGHLRTWLTYDLLIRVLRADGIQTLYVRNVTDIDDKIILKAQEHQCGYSDIATEFLESARADSERLGLLPPQHEPKASEYIDLMLEMIEQMVQCNAAYQPVPGKSDVYFNVEAVEDYGSLGHKRLDDLQSAERTEHDPHKKSELDFVLWKAADDKARAVGAVWESPFGPGRPGWHIECSAMSLAKLGSQFEIHGGGSDLIFPHHENERAQSLACGHNFADIWMHSGMLRINSAKMAKSVGNTLSGKALLESWHPEVIRLALSSAHYRSTLDFTEDLLQQSATSLDRLYEALALTADDPVVAPPKDTSQRADFIDAMHDDLHCPKAMAALFDLSSSVQRASGKTRRVLTAELTDLGQTLGLLREEPQHWLKQGLARSAWQQRPLSEAQVEELLHQRQQARVSKDYAAADSLRDQLSQAGIELRDHSDGTNWRWRH